MGYDASGTLTIDGRTERGTALLEHKDLIFRGASRVVIPLAQITAARAEGGTLYVNFGAKRAALEIGEVAAKWAKRILSPPSRLEKLGVKAGMHVALIGVVDEGFQRELSAAGVELSHGVPRGGAGLDILFYGVDTRAALVRVHALAAAIAPAGALWIIRRKGQSTVTESDSMTAGRNAGLVDVKVVSFSDTHTAEKYVIPRNARRPSTTSRLTPAGTRARSRRSSSRAPRRS